MSSHHQDPVVSFLHWQITRLRARIAQLEAGPDCDQLELTRLRGRLRAAQSSTGELDSGPDVPSELHDAIHARSATAWRSAWLSVHGSCTLVVVSGSKAGCNPDSAAAQIVWGHLTSAQSESERIHRKRHGVGPYVRAHMPAPLAGYVDAKDGSPSMALSTDLGAGDLRQVARILRLRWKAGPQGRILSIGIVPILLVIRSFQRLTREVMASSPALGTTAGSLTTVAALTAALIVPSPPFRHRVGPSDTTRSGPGLPPQGANYPRLRTAADLTEQGSHTAAASAGGDILTLMTVTVPPVVVSVPPSPNTHTGPTARAGAPPETTPSPDESGTTPSPEPRISRPPAETLPGPSPADPEPEPEPEHEHGPATGGPGTHHPGLSPLLPAPPCVQEAGSDIPSFWRARPTGHVAPPVSHSPGRHHSARTRGQGAQRSWPHRW